MSTLIKKPIITERSIEQTKSGFYTFMVFDKARKEDIKKAVEKQFNVKVISVRTVTMPGKTKKANRTLREIPKVSWKKAIVKLAKDQKIAIFDVS